MIQDIDAQIHHISGGCYCMGEHDRAEECEWLPIPKHADAFAIELTYAVAPTLPVNVLRAMISVGLRMLSD